MTTHALLVPWPISSGLYTYCGKPAGSCGDDLVASEPSSVDCPGCKTSMRCALENLQRWVPGLEGEPRVGNLDLPMDARVLDKLVDNIEGQLGQLTTKGYTIEDRLNRVAMRLLSGEDEKIECPECGEEIEDESECVDGTRCAACYEKGLQEV